MNARIEAEGSNLILYSSYDPNLVYELKRHIPAQGRSWDAARKVWIVDPRFGQKLADILAQYLGVMVDLPKIKKVKAEAEQRILEVRYVGMTKDRGGDDKSAFGWVNGQWSVIFPEDVLRDWFGAGDAKPGEEATLFGALGIKQEATADEIKTAYRRMAKQWHPDVCREPDAKEQFLKIQSAYEILSDTIKRLKYEAGLKLQASIGTSQSANVYWAAQRQDGYRSPLRCGLILATGKERLGRFVVEKIDQWADITNSRGQVLVTSWPTGADKFVETWN